jgi:hypothetical protein
MRALANFFRRCVASPKTSAAGLTLVVASIGAIAHNPAILMDQALSLPVWGGLISGLGLLFAHDQPGSPKDQPAPPKE